MPKAKSMGVARAAAAVDDEGGGAGPAEPVKVDGMTCRCCEFGSALGFGTEVDPPDARLVAGDRALVDVGGGQYGVPAAAGPR